MIHFNKKIVAFLAAGLLLAVTTGCQKQNPAGGDPTGTPSQNGQPAR